MRTFPEYFKAATGNPPFPWQSALYKRFAAGEFPSSANIPTGLGKTSVVTIWLIALALHPGTTPRRLVYVVNRRTVVDQTTDEVKKLRNALDNQELAKIRDKLASLCALPLPTPESPPFAISTLRGQFADNGEWCADPCRPAVIIGTVDMIGSGLLFSRYTHSFKTRPLHAGLLAQDVLLVHDEAHLEPAFQKLLDRISTTQNVAGDLRPMRVIELTATSRTADARPFGLDENPNDKDTNNEVVRHRFNAQKRITLVSLGTAEQLDTKIAALALDNYEGRAVLVFVRTVEAAMKIAAALDKGEHKGSVATLTGTMRGKERDELVSTNPVFQRFLPEANRANDVIPVTGTAFLVATSAGEVGVNLSADDLVCDLSTYESMAQRFGRVNRFGKRDDSRIIVVHETKFDTTKPLELSRSRTLALLQKLNGSASPAALDALPPTQRAAAFSPEPEQRVASEIQFDAWALTSIRETIAARPPVAPYLHGEAEWQPPETYIAWRDDRDLRHIATPEDFIEKFPLRPRELLRDTTKRVVATLQKLLDGTTGHPAAWLVAADGSVTQFSLSDFDKGAAEIALADATLILPVSLGGLENGLFTGKGSASDASGIERRESDAREDADLILDIAEEDSDEPRYLHWLVPQSDSVTSVRTLPKRPAETLAAHTAAVEANAAAIADKILPPDLAKLLVTAARLHDLGKNRAPWQRNLGNLAYDPAKPETILAKSAPGMSPRNVSEHYRHEFGSLKDANNDARFAALNDIERDIVLHLVAAHHGRARPHFPANEIFDYTSNDTTPEARSVLATEVPRRFARLQKRFGRWGLAWLESLLRAADYAASAGIVAPQSAATNSSTPIPRVPATGTPRTIVPTATLAVNPANPGHYFACCGLLELLSKLDPSAQGWFSEDSFRFHLASEIPISRFLDDLVTAEIAALDPSKPLATPLLMGEPFQLRLDWWQSASPTTSSLKTWSGQMNCLSICKAMQSALNEAKREPAFEPSNLLFDSRIAYIREGTTTKKVEPFYFDANRGVNAHARDIGFSPNDLKLETIAAPAAELLCLIGLQRVIPSPADQPRRFEYHIWHTPLTTPIIISATNGLLPNSGKFHFCFESWFRDGQRKNKAFLPAIQTQST